MSKEIFRNIVRLGESDTKSWEFIYYGNDSCMWAMYGLGGQEGWTGVGADILEARRVAKELAKAFVENHPERIGAA